MIKKSWHIVKTHKTSRPTSIIILLGVILGLIFLGGFNTVVEATNTEDFCISCHSMRDNVYKEYQKTTHYSNHSGVKVICSDCHVPKELMPKISKKLGAASDVYHTVLGTVDTPEKFEQHRLEMAKRVWQFMEANDSRECRNCHSFKAMALDSQDKTASKKHSRAMEDGKTCISCHKGIAHKLPVDES